MDRDASFLSDVGRLHIEREDDDRLFLNEDEQEQESNEAEEPVVEFDLGRRRGTSQRPQPRQEQHAHASAEAEAAYEEEPDTDEGVLEISENEYAAVRQLVERKVSFFKTLMVVLVANAALAAVSWWEVQPSGRFWFVWPLGLSTLAMIWLYVKVFLFSGQDMRTIIERRIDRMTQAELRRAHFFDR